METIRIDEFVRDRLVRVEEAAAALNVSAATIRRWCADGRLEGVHLPGPRHGLRVRARSIAAAMRGTRS